MLGMYMYGDTRVFFVDNLNYNEFNLAYDRI